MEIPNSQPLEEPTPVVPGTSDVPTPAESPTPAVPDSPTVPEPGPAEAPEPKPGPATPDVDPDREAPIEPPPSPDPGPSPPPDPSPDPDQKGADHGYSLKDKRVAILAADGVEQVELEKPRNALEQAGAETELVSLNEGEIQAFNHLDQGDKIPVDRTVSQASADDYDALMLPGGVANPDFLRMDDEAVAFVRSFAEAKKPIAAICHAGWTLVEAGVSRGRTLTSWPSLKTDIRNAGGTWVDEEVHVDQGLVTSRKPDDIPAFTEKMIEEFAEGRHAQAPDPAGATGR